MASGNAASEAEFQQAMKLLISEAQTVAPVLMMTGFPFDETRTTPYPGTESFYLLKDAEVYTNIVRTVCAESAVPVLDYFDLWSKRAQGDLLAEDGLHANPSGHQLLFEQLRDFLSDTYR